jgi:hypothetical protein
VCVKVFKENTTVSEKSFKVELKVGHKHFNHPNILKMLGAGRNHLTLNGRDLGEKNFIVSELA